ncbi:HNH endonuclease [Bifidobacterium vespertilionis]|uniref:HNH endonuclease n=2 Tax=Bifidobacterium vespertilionis TaxID=2562524 RepID=A0A5J5DUG3_9BIFI|nr:HNH endonuclease [Bifidobacterium vespertilionis]KAA8821209.1 HNH endonuclease [Bifidobacterium vespertilionis]
MDAAERDNLERVGWRPEGVAWHVSTAASVPVYRVYNQYTGEHLWTQDKTEYEFLTGVAPTPTAKDALAQLTVSDYLAPGYEREEFGKTWVDVDGNNCGTRDDILARDLTNITKKDDCRVATGTLNDPYTGTVIDFVRGTDGGNDGGVQIDHVVALSNAWKSGANGWTRDQRIAYANDPYVLLAVDDQANQDKSDSAADKWLPSNTAYRCDYVARQIGIKSKYKLTVTNTERDAMNLVLATCPAQTVPAGVGAPSVPAPPAPAPKPAPKPDPDPAPNPEPKPEVQYGIRPGAWCSPEGAIGYSAKGVQYVCRPSDSGKSLHWRRP